MRNNTAYKTFKLHPDQKQVVEAALDDAKRRSRAPNSTPSL